MEGTQTVTLTTVEHQGRTFYVLNDGEFFADVATRQVYSCDDEDLSNPLGHHDGTAHWTPPTPATATATVMAGLHLGGAEDHLGAQQARQAQQVRQAALEGERRRQERAAKLAETLAFDSPEEAEEEEDETDRITLLKEKAATSKAMAK